MIRDFTRKLRASLSYFFNEYETHHGYKELKVVKEIIDRAKKIKFSNKDKLTTHQLFSKKILDIIKEKKLLNFLQNGFIQQMFFIHNRIFILFELLELKRDKKWIYWKRLIKENQIGNPVKYFLYPKSSGNKIHQVYHLKKYNDFSKINFKQFKTVIEFGGGYGNMAYIFNKINPQIKYIIFDTYEVNLLQYYYLKKCNLDVGIGINNSNKIKLIDNLDDLKKIVKKTKKSNKNLFIANWSFSEISLNLRKKLFFIFEKYPYQIFSFQKNFENINNYNYFKKVNLNNNKRKLNSEIFKMNSKRNNFYLFCLK